MKVIQTKILPFIESHIFSLIYLVIFLYKTASVRSLDILLSPIELDKTFRPLLISILLLFTSKIERHLNFKILIGTAISFTSFYLYELQPSQENLRLLTLFSYTYFIFFFFLSIMTLGKSFTVLPAFIKTKYSGPYSFVRHPIYYSYIGIFGTFVATNISILNIISLLMLISGLLIRAIEEEKVISKGDDTYRSKMKSIPQMFHFSLLIPIILFCFNLYSMAVKSRELTVALDTKPIVLNPIRADDWNSFFIINHIFPRLSKDTGNVRSFSISKSISISCFDSNFLVTDSKCKKVKIEVSLKEYLVHCSGSKYTKRNFEEEIKLIAKSKNWLLPNFKFCPSLNGQSICFSFNKHTNVEAVL